jgi:hypothetical protein
VPYLGNAVAAAFSACIAATAHDRFQTAGQGRQIRLIDQPRQRFQ